MGNQRTIAIGSLIVALAALGVDRLVLGPDADGPASASAAPPPDHDHAVRTPSVARQTTPEPTLADRMAKAAQLADWKGGDAFALPASWQPRPADKQPAEPTPIDPGPAPLPPAPSVSGVMVHHDGTALARLDGVLVKLNESRAGWTLIAVADDRARLRWDLDGREITVPIHR